jgi:hypothetical protein
VKHTIIVALDVESSCISRPASDVKIQRIKEKSEEDVSEEEKGSEKEKCSVEVGGVSIYSRDRMMSATARSRRYCFMASQYSEETVSKGHMSQSSSLAFFCSSRTFSLSL